MGVAYIPACITTSQIGPMSRYLTKSVAKTKAIPAEKRKSSANNGITVNHPTEKLTPFTKAKTKTTSRLII